MAMNIALAQAVRDRRIVTFWYHGLQRTVELHTYGIHRDSGNEVLSGYQTAGFSNSSDLPGWRLYRLFEVQHLTVTDTRFARPRPGYNPQDSRMGHIFASA